MTDHHLIFDICKKGLRPPILSGIPEDYAQMMQKCWDVNSSKRPTIEELLIFANKKLRTIVVMMVVTTIISILSDSSHKQNFG